MTIQPATISPPREVPASIPRPRYVGRSAPDPYTGDDVQSAETIEKMRIAGRIAAAGDACRRRGHPAPG